MIEMFEGEPAGHWNPNIPKDGSKEIFDFRSISIPKLKELAEQFRAVGFNKSAAMCQEMAASMESSIK